MSHRSVKKELWQVRGRWNYTGAPPLRCHRPANLSPPHTFPRARRHNCRRGSQAYNIRIQHDSYCKDERGQLRCTRDFRLDSRGKSSKGNALRDVNNKKERTRRVTMCFRTSAEFQTQTAARFKESRLAEFRFGKIGDSEIPVFRFEVELSRRAWECQPEIVICRSRQYGSPI